MPEKTAKNAILNSLRAARQFTRTMNIPGIAIGDLLLILFFSLMSDRFLSSYNLLAILRNSCTLLLAALGLTWVILMSQNNVSVGAVVSMAAVMVPILNNKGLPVAVVLIAPLLMGMLVGYVNGVLIAKMKFDFWVVTFGTMSLMAGLALVAAGGETVSTQSEILNYIGNGRIAGIYVVIWMTALITAAMIFIQKKTKFGYIIYSIGGSESVAAVSGINVVGSRIKVHTISGLLAAVAGVTTACMNVAGSPTVGNDYSFNAMAAVVIGGTAFAGGKGGIVGTVFGTLMLRILASGLSMMNIDSTWQKAIIGVVIVALIVVDVLNDHRKAIKGSRRVYHDVA